MLVDREFAESAAVLKNKHNLGQDDASATALPKSKNAELVTGDIDFKALEKEVNVNWLTTHAR